MFTLQKTSAISVVLYVNTLDACLITLCIYHAIASLLKPCVPSANQYRVQITNKTQKASSTLRASQAVPHPSTDRALQRLTCKCGRDCVYSLGYGRWRRLVENRDKEDKLKQR